MKKLLFLTILLTLFTFSCGSDTTSETADHTGEEGYSCFSNQTCNTALECKNDKCEKETAVDHTGEEGEACFANQTCNTGLVCKSDKCEKETVVDPCEDISCGDNGSCAVSNGSPLCACTTGYHPDGLTCVINDVNAPCVGVSCSNHGTCAVSNGNPLCACSEGYHPDGLNCIEDSVTDPCEGISCGYNGNCKVIEDNATCKCEIGYHAVELNCVEIDECASNPCLNAGVCTDGIDSYSCECADGYSGDNCEVVDIVVDCGADGMCNIPTSNGLSAYKMDKYEVTAAQFKQCVDAGGCSTSNIEIGTSQYYNYNISGRENHPMNYVNWHGATEYCAWTGKRLPTEAEWVYAAYGTDGRVYPWGNEISCEHAVYGKGSSSECYTGDGDKHTLAVGSKPLGISPFGLHDMAGNVWEWLEDCYNSSCAGRVLRGGGWYYDASFLLSYNRSWIGPDLLSFDLGFRCVDSQ